ncbi:MAG: EAL domain-containing protein [Treponema sp.]|nr:EAL domain-containing protein [Treponema sp.]
MTKTSGFLNRIKKALKKYKYSIFVKDYFFTSNVRSSIYLSIIVAIFEIFMLGMMISGIIRKAGHTDINYLIGHTLAYIILLTTSLVMLVYSILYLRNKTKNKKLGYFIKIFFSVVMLIFGLYVSYSSSDRGGQVFAFLTVVIFVNCFFVWHPAISFIGLSSVFAIYIFLQQKIIPISLSIGVNSFTTLVAFFVTALNAHHQKRIEAEMEEKLNILNEDLKNKSLIDELTGLPNMNYFYTRASEELQDETRDIKKMSFIFLDVENFKNYNEKYGFAAGTNFLKTVGQVVKYTFEKDLVARFSDDHFVILTESEQIEDKIHLIQKQINTPEESVILGIKAGIYKPKDRRDSPTLACDHARYACESIKRHYGQDLIEYDSAMNKVFQQKQYIINNLDEAIKKNYIKVYYQPVVWAKDGKLCGVEALARWDAPEFGLLQPSAFVPILEEYHLIHKLDIFVMNQACKDIKLAMEKSLKILPISLNFSRLDFELMKPDEELEHCINEYGINRSDIHVEITESALSSSDERLKNSLEIFRKNGNSLWLDDFGSGYSGLNVLKDFSFDLMKIDMAFLEGLSENEKAKSILKSIIDLANSIGMQTLTEGVASQDACDFLKEIGCQRLQGYLFGKPMPQEELGKKIADGTYVIGD